MRSSRLEVLIFAEDKIGHQIAAELRRVQPHIPWNFSFASDSKSAIYEARMKNPSLVVLHEELPETTPEAFARELLQFATEVAVFCFFMAGHSDSYELEALSWPVTSWNRVAEQLLMGLPADTRERFGVGVATGPLADSLRAYSERYRTVREVVRSDRRGAWIPVLTASGDDRHLSSAPGVDVVSGAGRDGAQVSQSALEIQPNTRIEIFILAAALSFAGAAWLFQPEEEWVLLSGLRLISSIVLGASFVGFFLVRALARIPIK